MKYTAFLLVLALATPAVAAPTVKAAPGKGLTVEAGDAFAITLRARLQMRESVIVTGSAPTNLLEIKTVRIVTQGHVLDKDLQYGIQLALGPNDFEPNNASPVFDAFVEWKRWRDFNLKAGQYLVPFDRARTIREFALQFVDRQQMVGELALDRDVGVTVQSSDLFGRGGKLAYALGVFGGQGRNRISAESPGLLYVGRFTVRPMGPFDDDVEGDLDRLPRPRLAIGLGGAYNHDTTRQRSTTGSTLALGGFDYAHGAIDVVFKWRGLSFLGEALVRRQHGPNDFHEGVVDGKAAREWSRSGAGYLVQAGAMLTKRFEATARWDQLFALERTDPALGALIRTSGRELGVGLNAYFNGHALKLQADYTARFGDAAPATHLVRLQLDATF